MLPDGLSDDAFQATVSVQRLRTRVLDPDLRRAVEEFVSQCSRDSVPAGLDGVPAEDAIAWIEQRMSTRAERYEVVVELLGEQLRRELDRRDLA